MPKSDCTTGTLPTARPSTIVNVVSSASVTPWMVKSPARSMVPSVMTMWWHSKTASGYSPTSRDLLALRWITCLSTIVSGVTPPEPDSTFRLDRLARKIRLVG